MTLVPSDERYSPRVGPKVFSDVPTQAEVQSAKRTAGWIVAICLFLAGALAFGAVLYFLEKSKWQEAEQTLTEDKEAAERDLATRNAEFASLQDEFGPYRPLSQAEREGGVATRRIEELLAERPSARQRLTALYRQQWAAYDRLKARAWVGGQVATLQNDARAVAPLVTAIENLPREVIINNGGGSSGRQCDPTRQACPR